MKKILIASIWPLNKSSFAGTEKYTWKLAVALKENGYQVECVSPAKETIYCNIPHKQLILSALHIDETVIKEEMIKRGVKETIKLFSNSLSNFVNQQHHIDFLILNSPLFCLYSGKSASLLVLHDNPNELDNYFGKSNSAKLLGILAQQRFSSIIVPSKYYQSVFNKKLKISTECIPHSLDISILKKAHSLKKKNNLKLNNHEITILIPARLEPNQKGQDIAINAISKLNINLKSRILLKLSGLGSTYSKNKRILQTLAKNKGIKVEIENYPNIISEICSSGIIVLPSRFESFGYAAQESIALGKPVILSDIPTHQEIAKDTPNSYFFKSRSTSHLKRTLDKLLNYETFGAFPSENWYRRYEPKRWAMRYIKLINKIFNSSG